MEDNNEMNGLPKLIPTKLCSEVIKTARAKFPWHGMLKINKTTKKTSAVWPIIAVN